MESPQNSTALSASSSTTGQPVENKKTLTQAQDYYVTFVAAHGLSVEEDGTYTRITASEFARSIDVDRTTLYYWQKSIPNFWELVDLRAKEIFNRNRKHAIMRGLTMRALKGDSKQAEMLLSHYSDYVPPTQRHEVRVSGLGELSELARKKKNQQDAAN